MSASAFAKEYNAYVPKIYVTGFGRTNLVKDKGEPTEETVFFPSENLLKGAISDLAVPLTAFLLFNANDCLAKALVKTAENLFKDIEFDNDGEPVYDNISLEKDSDAYTFRYDFRYDVTDTAAKLNEYIERVKKINGVDKVALLPESMGGAVTAAYLYLYGYDSVDTVIFRSGAMMGIRLIGEVFTQNVYVDPQGVTGYINSFLLGSTSDKVLERALVNTLAKLPAKLIAHKLNRFIAKESDYIYENSLKRTFGNIPGLWSFVPSEYYEQAKATMLDETLNKKLIEKLDVYQYEIKPNLVPLLEEMQSDGVKVAVISHYGLYGVPLVPDDNYMSDFLVDTKYSSIGATCSQIGGSLGDGYIQQNDDGYNHISADNQIDASTCALPMNTWFIKGMIHTWYTDGYWELVNWIIYESESARIDENPNFPQFLYNNVETENLDILTKDSPDPLDDHLTAQIFADGIKTIFSKN